MFYCSTARQEECQSSESLLWDIHLLGFATEAGVADAAPQLWEGNATEGKNWSARQLRKPQNSGRNQFERMYKKDKFIAVWPPTAISLPAQGKKLGIAGWLRSYLQITGGRRSRE
jgi:hypothetical protein